MRKLVFVSCLVSVIFTNGLAFAELQFDADTGKWIEEGFDIRVFAEIPEGDELGIAFARGGAFGTDLYAIGDNGRKVYRIDSDGQVTIIGSTPARILGIDFPNPGSGFGDYVYLGSADSYYWGNKTIYRMDIDGNVEVFFPGSHFLGGTTNQVTFPSAGSPYGDYLFTQDDAVDQIIRIAPDGSASTFSSGIPLAADFMFDTYGQFDGQMLVTNIEKSEHGSHFNSVFKVALDGSKTVLLGDVFHMGGGAITPPGTSFGGKLYLVENRWPSPPTDLYEVSPDGSYEFFAQGFYFGDVDNVHYGPDGALYLYENGTSEGVIYQIVALGNVAALQIYGPDEVADNSQAQFKAVAIYDDGYENDVTDRVSWSVEPATYANMNYSSLLTTQQIHDVEESVTITTQYISGDVTVSAEKDVTIFSVCPSGYALQFDGQDDYVNCGNDESLNITGEITVMAWIQPHRFGNWMGILSKGRDSAYSLWHTNSNKLQVQARIGGHNVDFYGNTILNESKWYHVGFVYDRDATILYVDGKFDGAQAHNGNIGISNSNVNIGAAGSSNTTIPNYNFNGQIDKVVIYNRALSAEEIQANMHLPLTGSKPNLVAYWHFDEGAGQTAYDLSVNANDGQLGSDPNADDNDPNWVDSDAPVGVCTLEGLVERDLSSVFNAKLNILEQLDEAMAQEQIVLDMLNTHFKNRDFGTASKNDVVKAKQKIHTAIQHEIQAETDVHKSLNSLEEALGALDSDVQPHIQPEDPVLNSAIQADINGDRIIDFRDFAILSNNWLNSYQIPQ